VWKLKKDVRREIKEDACDVQVKRTALSRN
jgi:hypothetical protein